METKAVKSQMRRIIPSIAIISGFVVAFALAQEVMAQSAPAAEDDVKVKGAFDADDVAGGSGRKGETPAQVETKKHYSPYAGRKYPTRVYFGDTHHHTSNSGDAFTGGDRLGPEDSYRFARGEEVVSSSGVPVKLSRPLDFLVVSDHAEGLGLMARSIRQSGVGATRRSRAGARR